MIQILECNIKSIYYFNILISTFAATVEVADTAMIVGIVVGILAFFVIIIIIGVLIRKTRRNK